LAITRKTPEQVERMRAAGAVVADLLRHLRSLVAPGVALIDLDREAEGFIRERGARPTFKGYRGYPATLCLSVNEEVVHGIPGPRRLREGDILSIDVGATLDGWVGDAAITVPIGGVRAELKRLIDSTREALHAGVEAARVGNFLGRGATASCASTAATAWAEASTRIRRCPTTDHPEAVPGCTPAGVSR
jgi:methionyl aminopeptidase